MELCHTPDTATWELGIPMANLQPSQYVNKHHCAYMEGLAIGQPTMINVSLSDLNVFVLGEWVRQFIILYHGGGGGASDNI